MQGKDINRLKFKQSSKIHAFLNVLNLPLKLA